MKFSLGVSLLPVLASLLCLTTAASARTIFDISSPQFKAVADGNTDNTAAIQAALNAAKGEATVLIPATPKPFLSGPLTMPAGTHLKLEKGAVLQLLPMGRYPGGDNPQPFLSASNVQNIVIEGPGMIEGQGKVWWDAYDALPKGDKARKVMRPKAMIRISDCSNVTIDGLVTQNPPNVHYSIGGENIVIRNITIESPEKSHNTDGIDIGVVNGLIENCSISCGDDNIAIGGSTKETKGLIVRNCWFGFGHGMSIGSFTKGGVSGLRVENCVFEGTKEGIRLKSQRGRGGMVRDLVYSDLRMTGPRKAIAIASYYDEKPNASEEVAASVNDTTPFWQDITIRNVTCDSGGLKGSFAGTITGLPEAPIRNLTLENVTLSAQQGLVLRHVHGLKMLNVKISPSTGPEITKNDVQ